MELPYGLRILVADDVALNRRLLIRQLRRILVDPTIVEVETGEEALAATLTVGDRFHLLFLDEIYSSEGLRGMQVATKV
jgi:CheY-like chemotaxis protein